MMNSTMLGLLSLQFILGAISNLYVKFPDTADQATLWHTANTNWMTLSHMIVGTVIVVLGLVILVKGIKLKQRMFSPLAIIALVAILVSAVGGEEFVRTQKDAFSLVMAFGFIVAMGLYGRLLAAALVSEARGQ